MTEHDEAPLHAESCTLLVPLQPIVAPLTGVTPSLVTTRMLTGLAACTPTGVDGFAPFNRIMLSLAAAPYVSAPVMIVYPPLTGSVTAMFCGPSECAGAATVRNVPVAASGAAELDPTTVLSPLPNPVPCSVIAPPFTLIRAGHTESA